MLKKKKSTPRSRFWENNLREFAEASRRIFISCFVFVATTIIIEMSTTTSQYCDICTLYVAWKFPVFPAVPARQWEPGVGDTFHISFFFIYFDLPLPVGCWNDNSQTLPTFKHRCALYLKANLIEMIFSYVWCRDQLFSQLMQGSWSRIENLFYLQLCNRLEICCTMEIRKLITLKTLGYSRVWAH